MKTADNHSNKRLEEIIDAVITATGAHDHEASLCAACEGNARVLEHRGETLASNAVSLAKRLAIPPGNVVRMACKAPSLLYRKPELIDRNARVLSKDLRTSRAGLLRLAANRPEILLLQPLSVRSKITHGAERLGLREKEYCKLCRQAPMLLTHCVETIVRNVDGISAALDIPQCDAVKVACRKPVILLKSPETLQMFMIDFACRFGLAMRDTRRVIARYPGLVFHKIDTMERNIEGLMSGTFLDREAVVHAATKLPPLFYLKPEGVVGKLKSAAALLGVEQCVLFKAFARMPTIAGRDPVKVARHVRLAQRISVVLGGNATAAEVLSTSPVVPTYSSTRLAVRYLFARLGLWGGKWSTLVAMSDSSVHQRLDDYLDGLPEDSDIAGRVRRLMKRGLRQ